MKPTLFTHKHSTRSYCVKGSVTLLVVLAIVFNSVGLAIAANVVWLWVDED